MAGDASVISSDFWNPQKRGEVVTRISKSEHSTTYVFQPKTSADVDQR